MKKLFLLLAFYACAEFTYGATLHYVGGIDNNWNTPGNWWGGATGNEIPTSNDDVIFNANSPNCTVNLAGLAKTLTFENSYVYTITMSNPITVSGDVTLGTGMGIAGTSALIVNASGMLTSNGKTWPNGLTFTGPSQSHTLVGGDWRMDGTLNNSAAFTVTIDNYALYVGGGIIINANTSGTTSIVMNGTGTWSSTPGRWLYNNLTFDSPNGTITISGTVLYSGSSVNPGTLKYNAGTMQVAGSTLRIISMGYPNKVFLDTEHMQWNNITTTTQGNQTQEWGINLLSDINYYGTWTVNNWTYIFGKNINHVLPPTTLPPGLVALELNSTYLLTTYLGTTTLNLNASGIIKGNPNMTGARLGLYVDINTLGTYTFSGSFVYFNKTFRYTAGTVQTTGFDLGIDPPATMNTAGVAWDDVIFLNYATPAIATIASTLTVKGTLTYRGAGTTSKYITFNGGNIDAYGNINITNSHVATSGNPDGGGGSATLRIVGDAIRTLSSAVAIGKGRLPNVTIDMAPTGGTGIPGTLTLQNTITCAGNWTYIVGTVNSGGSTVAFTGNKNLDGNTMHFFNTSMYENDRNLTSNLNVDNDFTIYSGATLTQNTNTMFIGGNWDNNGTYNTSNALVTFNGSSAQTLTNSSGVETFNYLRINKLNGTPLIPSPGNSIVINNDLQFTKGNIVFLPTSTDFVEFENDATASTASNNSFVEGYVKKTGDEAFNFPIGLGARYHPISISAPSTVNEFTAKYFNSNPQAVYNPTNPNSDVSNCEYWTLERTAGSSNVFVTLKWNVTCPVTNPSLVNVAHWDGSQWANLSNDGSNSSNTSPSQIGSVTTENEVIDFGAGGAFCLMHCSGIWTQKTDFGGVARLLAVGFSTSTKGYIGTGANWNDDTFYDDFWEYDPLNDTWTQKANFGGTARRSAVGFSIGTKGYIGTGYSDATSNVKDFWEYDPFGNTWTQKADFGGTARSLAVGFSIGSYGYIGTGTDGSLKNDFWEYDPTGNSWTQKANFGGTARAIAVGFSIGAYGYIGTGQDINGYTNDFWQYDPSVNSWTQKANFSGGATGEAVCFATSSLGYIGKGSLNNYYAYEPLGNTWTQVADFNCASKYEAVGFSINGKGYVGTGTDCAGGAAASNDFWEYTPGTCSGSSLRIINSASTFNNEEYSELQLGKIYPNPAINEAILNYAIGKNQKGNVELYSSLGQKIISYELHLKGEVKIDLTNIQTGIYFYTVKVNGEIMQSDKLIVIK